MTIPSRLLLLCLSASLGCGTASPSAETSAHATAGQDPEAEVPPLVESVVERTPEAEAHAAPVESVPEPEPSSAAGQLLANGAHVECPEEARCQVLAAQNRQVLEMDHDGDGRIDQRNVYTYDAHGGISRMDIDADADGTTDQTILTERTYDARGNVLTDETDMNGDGVVDRRSWHTYDASDRMLTWTMDSADAYGIVRGRNVRRSPPRVACDGVPDVRRTNVYNDAGDLLRTEIDNGVDGTVDLIIHYRPACPPPYGTDTCPDYTTERPSRP